MHFHIDIRGGIKTDIFEDALDHAGLCESHRGIR